MTHRVPLAILFTIPLVFLVPGCCQPHRRPQPSSPPTAVLGAFDKEITLLEDRLTDRAEHTIQHIRFVTGKLAGQPVVLAWTGIGKVNAAMTTTLLIEHFKPARVLFTGIAGAADPNLHPGDIVIAEKTAHHDMGVLWPDRLYYKGVKNRLTGWENPVFFPADESLLALARQAACQVRLEPIETFHGPRIPRIVTGTIVTGDIFVASSKKTAELRQALGAHAVEMEGAAVAQLCYQYQIPHLVIRSISDRADEGAIQDKQTFYILAAANSSSLVAKILQLLPAHMQLENRATTR